MYMATGELSLSLANSAIAASPANVYASPCSHYTNGTNGAVELPNGKIVGARHHAPLQ